MLAQRLNMTATNAAVVTAEQIGHGYHTARGRITPVDRLAMTAHTGEILGRHGPRAPDPAAG